MSVVINTTYVPRKRSASKTIWTKLILVNKNINEVAKTMSEKQEEVTEVSGDKMTSAINGVVESFINHTIRYMKETHNVTVDPQDYRSKLGAAPPKTRGKSSSSQEAKIPKERCTKLVKNNENCKNGAVEGTKFCKVHSKKPSPPPLDQLNLSSSKKAPAPRAKNSKIPTKKIGTSTASKEELKESLVNEDQSVEQLDVGDNESEEKVEVPLQISSPSAKPSLSALSRVQQVKGNGLASLRNIGKK